MKRTIVKVVLAGVIIFLSLPLIFDIEEEHPALPAQEQEVLAFNAEVDDAMLPVYAAASQEKKTGNLFTNYAKKASRFYIQGFKGRPARSSYMQEGGLYSRAGESQYGSLSNYQLEFDDDFEALPTPSTYSRNASSVYTNGVGVKQVPHKDAQVKGLFDSSLTDRDKFESKNVYAGVMRKVDETAPDIAPKRQAAPSSNTTTRSSVLAASNYAEQAQAAASAVRSGGSAQPSGVAGRQGASSEGGRAEGFNSPGFGSDVLTANSPQQFEASIRSAEGSMRGGSSFGGGSSGGSVSAGGGASNSVNPSLPGNLPNVNLPQPGQPQKPGEKPKPGAEPAPVETPTIFNPEEWTPDASEKDPTSCDVLTNSGPEEEAKIPGQEYPSQPNNPPATEPAKEDEPKKLTSCSWVTFDAPLAPQMSEYTYYVSLGAADEKGDKYVTITKGSIPDRVLDMMGIENIYRAEGDAIDNDTHVAYGYISREEHEQKLKDPKTFTLTVDSREANDLRYRYTTMKIGGGNSLETEEGAKETFSGLNNHPVKQEEYTAEEKAEKKDSIRREVADNLENK